MKKLPVTLLLILCTTLAGCVKYKVTLTDGSHFTVLGKPKYDEEDSVYHYKSGGKTVTISAGRVSSIQPSSEASDWEGPSASGETGESYWETKK